MWFIKTVINLTQVRQNQISNQNLKHTAKSLVAKIHMQLQYSQS